jgi:hypothetical protein
MRFQPIKCNMMKLTRKKKHHIDFENQLEGSKLEFIQGLTQFPVELLISGGACAKYSWFE